MATLQLQFTWSFNCDWRRDINYNKKMDDKFAGGSSNSPTFCILFEIRQLYTCILFKLIYFSSFVVIKVAFLALVIIRLLNQYN